eukprot:9067120-Alexandrium_andersonii.AAC.1
MAPPRVHEAPFGGSPGAPKKRLGRKSQALVRWHPPGGESRKLLESHSNLLVAAFISQGNK